jgi:hypothetical protein
MRICFYSHIQSLVVKEKRTSMPSYTEVVDIFSAVTTINAFS